MNDDITKQLWDELESKNPDEKKIRGLVAQEAKIKGEFMHDLMWLVYAPDTWEDRGGKGLDVKFVQLMIDLGAELNFIDEDDGTNCLWLACDTYRPELVEILLKAGVNPNIINTETFGSTLDNAYGLLHLETRVYDRGCDVPMQRIVDLLIQYGAKTAFELKGHH